MGNQNHERLELQTKGFIVDLLADINTEDSIQDILAYIMKEMGVFTHSDRVCIYECSDGKDCVEKIYQWRAGNLTAEEVKMQPIQRSTVEGWVNILNQKQLVVIENRDSIRDTMPEEYDLMERQGMKSLLLIPVYARDRLIACMSLVNLDFTLFAVVEDTLKFLGKQIGAFYRRERVNHKYMLFMEGIRSSNLSEFIVDYTTNRYEAFRITRVLNGMIPEEGDWEWLRQFYAAIIKPEYKNDLLKRTEREYMESFLCTEKSSFAIDIEREVDGNNTWFRLEFSVVSLNEEGHLERFVLLVKDITQMKREEEEHQQMIRALSGIYNASAMIDLQHRMVHPIRLSKVSQQFIPNEVVPEHVILDAFCNGMVQPEYVDSVREFMNLDTMQHRLKNTNLLTCEYQGTKIEWARINLAPAKWNKDGTLEKVVFAVQDITEQKRREEQMQYKIEHDALTGTLNRAAFNRTTKIIENTTMPFGFVLMDIDRFKQINDTYGHDVGDAVLTRLVFVLNDKMRTTDKVFRLGGDEFAIIMNHLMPDSADYIKQVVEAVNAVTTAGMGKLPGFSVSAGVTFALNGYSEMIYHNADKALYRTKETTRRGCTVFEEMEDVVQS